MNASRSLAVAATAAVLALPACGASQEPPASTRVPTPGTAASAPGTTVAAASGSADIFPGASWERTDPGAAGLDPVKLEAIARDAGASQSTCLAVFRDGKLVADWYWNGTTADTPQEAFSVTKSFTSTLVGIAQDEGRLRIEDKASAYLPAWVGTPSDGVTLKDLLSNTSGRHWDLVTDYVTLTNAPDKVAFAVGLGQDTAPGRTWAYNNAAIQTFSAILRKATGEDAAAYAKRRLFDPIGMDHSAITHDQAGNTLMYMGLQSTCLDMGRFGHLLLHGGSWNGRQVVSRAYVEAATGRASQDLNGAYGYLFWVNRPGRMAGATHPATVGVDDGRPVVQWVPGAPEDMFWAAGVGGQTIQIDPGTRTVVTRIGSVNTPEGIPVFDRKGTARVVTEALVRR